MEYRFPLIDEGSKEYDDLLYKRCTKCHEIKLKTEFYRCTGGRDGLAAACKVCHISAVNKWRIEHPEQARKRSLKSYYQNREKRLKYQNEYDTKKTKGRNTITSVTSALGRRNI